MNNKEHYKCEVLSHTNGRTIHRVRNDLGIVLSGLTLYKNSSEPKLKNLIEINIMEIYKLTGVGRSFESLL